MDITVIVLEADFLAVNILDFSLCESALKLVASQIKVS
jgi:hypothetical protein